MTAFIILAITAVIAPAGVLFTVRSVEAGEDIMLRANESIANIENDTIRSSWHNVISSAYDAADTNIEITSDMFRYAWVIMIILAGIVSFLFTRQIVEYNTRGGII